MSKTFVDNLKTSRKALFYIIGGITLSNLYFNRVFLKYYTFGRDGMFK